ncbi:MAG: threonylcarbamoyl-AMP synthase [Phycisphaerae bacterium]
MQAGPEEIAEAVRRLKAGRLVAFPTETVYGLGARALDAAAVARVFEVKGRPARNPVIVHVSGPEMAPMAAAAWPREAEALARAYWPGPLSMVLPKAAGVPDIVTAGGPTVAVRCPDHPVTLALIEALGEPIVGPSANVSGRVSPTRAEHVRESFDEETVFVLDGGACTGGIESTVVDLSGSLPRVLRPGLVTGEMIAGVIGRAVGTADREGPGEGGVLASPGLLDVHYAPKTRAVLVSAEEAERLCAGRGGAVVVIAWGEGARAGDIVLPRDARGYAAGLYAALREADGRGAELIAVIRPQATGEHELWAAVMDRLRRATSR